MYGTVEAAADHWVARGYLGNPTTELLLKATIFVDMLGWDKSGKVPIPMFPGTPTSSSQAYEWPRENAINVYGIELASDEVPSAVQNATYEAAFYEYSNPGSLNNALSANNLVKREKFDKVEFEYELDAVGSGLVPSQVIIPAVMTYLAPVIRGGSNAYGITGVVA